MCAVKAAPDPGALLFVDGLPLSATSEDLKMLVASVAAVERAIIIRDRSGRSLRFGLVLLVDQKAAHDAEHALDGTCLQGFALRVVRARGAMLEQEPLLSIFADDAEATAASIRDIRLRTGLLSCRGKHD